MAFGESLLTAEERKLLIKLVDKDYDGETLTEDAKDFMDKHVGIFSGLFGIVSPKTLIPNYKLKMNVQALQHFWRPILTNILKEEDLVIDLLPQVHRKSYDKKGVNVVEVEFLIFNKNSQKTSSAGHYGKAVKGNC